MRQPVTHVCVATLGGQPQVVTLALDALLTRGKPIEELIVVHLALDNPRYRAAHQRLEAEFVGARYGAHTCRYTPVLVRLHSQIIADLNSEEAIDAARITFDRLFCELKRQGCVIHLCVSGGRRLLGHLALAVASRHFDYADRVWHLFSPDPVREQTRDGAQLHLPPEAEVRLLPLPFDVQAPAQGRAPDPPPAQRDPDERRRCQAVADQLTDRPRMVLRAYATGCETAQEVADLLHIAAKTVYTHKRAIDDACRTVWDLPPDAPIRPGWLRSRFSSLYEE